MAKYRKRPRLLEATQWFHNGDHPRDQSAPIDAPDSDARLTEGKVVRYFKSLNIPGDRVCPRCGNPMKNHGEIAQANSSTGDDEIVCPGDYILTTSEGLYYKMPPKEFEKMYEPYHPTT